MSHCNITMRDKFSDYDRLRLEIEKLKVELSFMQGQRDDAESNLRSIFHRIKNGDQVYLVYPDGQQIYIIADPAPRDDERGR